MSNWKDVAKAGDEARRRARHGDREKAMAEIAPVDVLHRTIPVANFLEQLAIRDNKLATAVRDSGFSRLQILARWAALDWDAGLIATARVAAGEYSVRKLQADFELFRRQAGKKGPLRRLIPTEPLLAAIGRLLGGQISSTVIRPKVLGSRPIDMELRLQRPDLPPSRVALMLVGPYANSTLYQRRMCEHLLRAWAIAWLFDDVVVAIPEPAAVDGYNQWLIDAQDTVPTDGSKRGPRVHVLPMEERFFGAL